MRHRRHLGWNLSTGATKNLFWVPCGRSNHETQASKRVPGPSGSIALTSSSPIARYIMKQVHGQRQHGQLRIWRRCAGCSENVSHISLSLEAIQGTDGAYSSIESKAKKYCLV